MNKEENTLTIETYISWKDKRYVLKDFIKETLKEIEDNNKRINKAIDYIENNDLYTQDIDYDYDDNMVLLPPTDELERKELLEILRGEDNE